MTSRLSTCTPAFALIIGLAFTHPHCATVQAAQAPASPPSLTGTWSAGLIGDHIVPMAFVLEQQGSAVTGALGFMGRDYPLAGEVADGRFTLTGKFPANGGRDGTHSTDLADITITGGFDANGGLAGDFLRASAARTIKWTAERLRERKPAAMAAAGSAVGAALDGPWTMTVVEAQLQIGIALTQSGTRLTGTATSDHLGTLTLEGTFTGGTVMLVGRGAAQGQDIRMDFTGKYTADGTLAGDVTSPVGTMAWTAARVKP